MHVCVHVRVQAKARDAIREASVYMTDLFDESVEFCNYALALSTFSLLRAPSASSSPTITRMVAELKSRILSSKDCKLIKVDDDTCTVYMRTNKLGYMIV